MIPATADHVVSSDDSAWGALSRSSRHEGGTIAVIENGRIVGTIAMNDLHAADRRGVVAQEGSNRAA